MISVGKKFITFVHVYKDLGILYKVIEYCSGIKPAENSYQLSNIYISIQLLIILKFTLFILKIQILCCQTLHESCVQVMKDIIKNNLFPG